MAEINKKEVSKYIPLDKSWIIRMGALDVLNGYDDIVRYVDSKSDLGGDLQALGRIARDWNKDGPLDVGESGTIYRFARYALWNQGSDREITTHGTLTERAANRMCNDSEIVNMEPEELLKLDNNTTQWATMAYLCGNREKVKDPKLLNSARLYKLRDTYEAVDHWSKKRASNNVWEERIDPTIENQAMAYLQMLNGEKPDWQDQQAEDFFFAAILGFKSPHELANDPSYASLGGHETNRLEEIGNILWELTYDKPLTTRDHRGMQAGVMWQVLNGKKVSVVDPRVVDKSWPSFWDFIDFSK
jgi:hypothetical protein